MPDQKKQSPALPENAGLTALYRVMDSFEAMSDEELFAFSVRAGIHRPDGRLTPTYGGENDGKSIAAV